MFVMYALPIGLLLGFLLAGRPAGLGAIKFRLAWLAVAGFLTQIVLFSAPVSDRIGDAGPLIYAASTATVLAAVVANVRIAGMPLVAIGAASNLAAIIANGWLHARERRRRGGHRPWADRHVLEQRRHPVTGPGAPDRRHRAADLAAPSRTSSASATC